jgi:hypothetical protein
LRANGILLNNFWLIWVILPSAQKYSAFPHPNANRVDRHCARREAIHASACCAMYCFAACAMTTQTVIVRESGRPSIAKASMIEL